MKLAIMFWYGPNLDNVDIFKKSIVTVCEDSVMITCLKSFYLVNERSIPLIASWHHSISLLNDFNSICLSICPIK